MTTQLTVPSVEALRAEVSAVLAGPAGQRARAAMLAAREWTGETDPRPVYRLLGAHRLLAAGWPGEYGGRGLPATAAAAVVEQMITDGVPDTLHTLSVQICGTFLLSAGTPRQRAELLPALAAGQRYCTVLYTEPEIGSDLAALTTRAEDNPDGGWWLTGRKIYSVRTPLADLALVAARTGEPGSSVYQGITLFLIPLDSPGVTVRTLPAVADEAFGDVLLEGVPVGPESVVGPVGGAWPLITGALALERTGVDHVAKAEAWLRAAFDSMSTVDEAVDVDPAEVAEAGRLRTRVHAARALSRACVADLDGGRVDPVHAAATKLWCSETGRAVATWGTRALSERALWNHRDPAGIAGGRLEAAYREAPGLTISAGTSEMMLMLVAGAGLTGQDHAPSGEEPLLGELRRALRVTFGGDDPWAELAGLGVLGLAAPRTAGGAGLGPAAALAACEEAGAAGYDGQLLDTLTAIDALVAAADPRAADLITGAPAALALAARPNRPVTAGAYVLAGTGRGLPTEPAELRLLSISDCTVAGRVTANGPVDTITATPPAGDPLLSGPAAAGVLAADLLRRAAWFTGLGAACLSAAVRRAGSRSQFGRPILDNQAIGFGLAELATWARALRALTAEQATEPDPVVITGLLAEAAEFATEAAGRAVHVHGAFGLLAGSPVAAAYRAVPLAAARCPARATLRRHAATGDPRWKGSPA